jgi:SAM-dependent methyltransferase
MKFPLHQPTLKLLTGLSGIELGAASHNPFGVNAINVAPKFDEDLFQDNQVNMGEQPTKIDMYGEADNIPVKDKSQDFVLSSHVFEHIPDPISALLEWQRVIKPGGYVVMIVPQPDALAGDNRPLSTYDRLIKAHREKWNIETAPAESLYPGKGGHYWKFTSTTLRKFFENLKTANDGIPAVNWQLVGTEDPDSKVGNGFWLAYRVP